MTLIKVGIKTHQGMQREENQDYADFRFLNKTCFDRKGVLMVLADGMGGHAGGSVASKMAVETLIADFCPKNQGGVINALKIGFLKANDLILARSRQDTDLKGMGTTLTAVAIQEDQLFFAHVGDSRGYLITGQKIYQLTQDHTYVAELLNQGLITQKEARNHPYDNIITRAIGVSPNPIVDHCLDAYKTKPNQAVVLCSDGLYKCVRNREILEIAQKNDDPAHACRELVDLANQRGGPDNITVMIALLNPSNTHAKPNWLERLWSF